jgi:phosphate-selective porin
MLDEDEEPGLAGWHGSFYIRDRKDLFRLYPRGRLHVDFNSYMGRGVHDVTADDGGNALKPRLFLRRLRLEVAGTFMERFQFLMGVDFGGQALANANGKTQTAAAAAGDDPDASSARFAGVQTPTNAPSIADAWINYSLSPALNFMFGQEKTVFSMENRTSSNSTTLIDRNVAIRSFATNDKETGITLWGDIGKKKLITYEAGVYGGDGRNRPQVDSRVDVIGRVLVRPFSGSEHNPVKGMHVGMSARHGDRDPSYVGYSYQAITSGQGFTLWDPRYRDSAGRTTHVIPSGAQNSIGGEVRVPVSKLDLRAEAYWVANRTREGVDGYQLTNTERLGAVTGLGWYVMASAWVFGDTFVTGDPGLVRPTHVDFAKPPNLKKGLEVTVAVAGIDADYDGASRGGSYDANTPGAPGVGTDITVRQYSVAATYWYTRHVRATINYNLYHLPSSGSPDNLGVVPGNLTDEVDADDAHVLHELGTRIGVQF